MKQHLFLHKFCYLVIVLAFTSCSLRKSDVEEGTNQTNCDIFYDCDLFSLTMPSDCSYYEDSIGEDSRCLDIQVDSLGLEEIRIFWEAPNSFPGTMEQLVSVFTYKEQEDLESINSFYDVVQMDSIFTIDGYPTFSISSIYGSETDTIIQSRTALIIPQKCDMMILQRGNSRTSSEDVEKCVKIVKSIKIK